MEKLIMSLSYGLGGGKEVVHALNYSLQTGSLAGKQRAGTYTHEFTNPSYSDSDWGEKNK